jgi:plastocyanin
MPTSVPPTAARLALGLALLVTSLGLAPPVSAATVTVHIGAALDPKAITITPGTVVRWINESDNRYRIRSRSGPEEFDSGNLEPGESFTFVFRLVGTYDYVDDRDRGDPAFHGTVAVRAAGDAGPPTPPSEPGSSAPPRAGQPAVPTSVTVHMAGERFSPSTVTIAAGGRVTFLNDDDREHTATATAGAFDTGVLGEGGSAAESFATAGTFAYLCAIHPQMTGTVTVRAATGVRPTAPESTPPPVATPGPSPTPAVDVPGPVSPVTEASIADFAFAPSGLDIRVGDSIRWRNAGAAPHTVTAGDGTFDSGLMPTGATFERRFDEVGSYPFVCSFHPAMTGTVRVTAAAGAGASSPPSARPSVSSSDAAHGRATRIEPPATPAAGVEDGLGRTIVALVLVAMAVLVFGWLLRGTMRPPRAVLRRR